MKVPNEKGSKGGRGGNPIGEGSSGERHKKGKALTKRRGATFVRGSQPNSLTAGPGQRPINKNIVFAPGGEKQEKRPRKTEERGKAEKQKRL